MFNEIAKMLQEYDHTVESSKSCPTVASLPEIERCDFILRTENCHMLIPVYQWLYCDYPGNLGIFIVIMVLISMFIIITSVADVCICPCIETISSVLNLSDTLAGCTVLAFGNGAPDVLTALASKQHGLSQVFYTGLAGGCMFVTTLVAGMVLVIQPFRLDGWSMVRDLSFLLISYVTLFTCYAMGVIHLQMCLSFIALYIVYIAMVLFGQWGSIRYIQLRVRTTIRMQQFIMSGMEVSLNPNLMSVYSSYPLLREHRFSKNHTAEELKLYERETEINMEAETNIFLQFLNVLKPFSKEDWEYMPLHERILIILQTPVSTLMKLAVPICNLHEPNQGWSKLLFSINMILYAPALIFFFDGGQLFDLTWKTSVLSVPLLVILCVPGIFASILVLIFTKVESPFPGFSIFSFMGFSLALFITNMLCNVVVDVLQATGVKLGVSYSTIGMTVLAWGNSLGDLVSNITLAKNGMSRMAFAACFGSPLFTCIFGGGVTSLFSLLESQETSTKVKLGLTGGLLSYFVLASIISSLTSFIVMDMDGRRSYGCYLVTLYLTFLVLVITVEIIRDMRRH